MRFLYLSIFLFASLIGSVRAQIQSDLDFGPPERLDISKSVQIYPNPAVEVVNVRMEHINLNNVKVTLHNIIGNEMNVETELVDEHTLQIKVKDLDAGYYLLALNDEQSKFKGIYKFLKR